MNLLVAVTLSYIYHYWSTRKTFREEIFTPVIMKKWGRLNDRKQRNIKNGEQYITLDISLNFFNLEKMQITSSEPKYYLGRSCKGFITSLGLNIIIRSNRIKKAMFAISEVSLKYLSKINN